MLKYSIRFHAIYWPAFLMAADLPVLDEILCHSHWLVDGVKVLTAVDIVVLL
jgi:methionyl-tRNA synthetase